MSKIISAVLLALALALSTARPEAAEVSEGKNPALDIDWKDHGKWKHLSRSIGTYAIEKVLSDPEVEAELKALTGEYYLRVRTFRTIAPIIMTDSTVLEISGTGEYQWEIESKYILIDWSKGEIQVCITAKDYLYVFSRKNDYKDLPFLFKTTYYRHEIHAIIKNQPSHPDFHWIK
ncbi:MAG: hypothetical protein IT565_13710 [Rhodospirillales bacterium]|nr:hypothetical protein [Rhodospirillales bacterium]